MLDGDTAPRREESFPVGAGLLMGMGRTGPRGRNRYAVAAALGLAAVYVIDLLTPLGVADGMLYALVVLLGLWRPERSFIFFTAGAGIVLTLLGWILSPPGEALPIVATNRIYSIVVILGTAFAVHKFADYERGFQVLAQAVEQAPAGILIADTAGTIVYANPAVTRLSGHERDALIGRNPRVFASGKTSGEKYENLWQAISSGQVWNGEILNRRRDGAFVWEHEVIAPVRDGQGRISHYVAVKEDITARKKLEEHLRSARIAAEAANASKSSFLANMSHELRTPLNAIIGFSEALKLGIPAPLSHPKHVEYLNLIHQSGNYLLQLINDILDLSRIESGMQAPRDARICLPDAIETCIRMVRERANNKKLRLEIESRDDCPCLLADERMVKQILLNLLTNAIKFTPDGGAVSIRVDLDGRVGDLVVRVADSGVGIAPENLARIFTPFTRADGDAYVSRQEGTGLGLALTRKMAELHGGSLVLDSVPGVGTTATVRFPATRLVPFADSA